MLLRFFLNLIKPTNEQLRSSGGDGKLSRFKLRVYKRMLEMLQKSYLRHAISDTVILENGSIKIVHELRDVEFENELNRNGIDIRPRMMTSAIPLNVHKVKRGMWRGYFRFKDLLSIYVDNEELFIKHDEAFSLCGNVPVMVKVSLAEDIIARSLVEIKADNRHSQLVADKKSEETYWSQNTTNKPRNKRLFHDEKIGSAENLQHGADVSRVSGTQRIVKHGFEIDPTF